MSPVPSVSGRVTWWVWQVKKQVVHLGVAYIAVLLIAGLGSEAHAYLDPGTGSYVLQLLVAGLLGAFFAMKLYWRRFKAFLFRKQQKPEEKPGGHE